MQGTGLMSASCALRISLPTILVSRSAASEKLALRAQTVSLAAAALDKNGFPESLYSRENTAHHSLWPKLRNVSRVSECESKNFSGYHSYIERSVATGMP